MPKETKHSKTIGFVLDDGLDSSDGVQQYVLTLGKEYKDSGHNVHYLVGETKRKDIANVHSLARNIKVRFNGNRLTVPLPASKRKIQTILTRYNFDVLHVQMPYSPFLGARVIKLADSKTVIAGTFHIYPYGLLAKVGTRFLGLSLRSSLKRFDLMFSVSSVARDFAKESFGIQTSIVPNVVSLSKYTQLNNQIKPKDDIINIVYVGRLVERKGCKMLLEAFMNCAKDSPNLKIKLTVCGKGPQLADLKEAVVKNNLEDKVKFLGFVTEEDKIKYLQTADIAIFPSYGGESFGIVLIEAIASGSGCVIGGNNPGYASVLKDIPKSIIDVQDQKVFTAQLNELIHNQGLRADIHSAQQKIIKQYDSKAVASKLLNIYDCKIIKNE